MSNYTEILEILSVDDDSNSNRLEITSNYLKEKEQQLEELNLSFDEHQEGINIKLDAQAGFKIYKTKQDVIMYLTETSFDKDILIIEDKKVWEHQGGNKDQFIENINLWHKYKTLLTDTTIEFVDYINNVDQEFILLSIDKGKMEIGFRAKPLEYFSQGVFEENTFTKIKNTIENNGDFISFFKNAFIDVCANQPQEERFSYAVKNINIIYDNANRNYNLYQNKFSFEEFSKGLEHAKDEYLKNYQLYLSEFLSKTSNLPIQLGVYLFLIYRFSDVDFILSILLILIFILSLYTFKDISLMIENVGEIKTNFNHNIKSIKDSSGLDTKDFKKIKKQVNDKIDKFACLLNSYKYMNVVANLLFAVIIFYFLFFKCIQ